MNERQFKRLLKSKSNINGNFTNVYLLRLIEEGKNTLPELKGRKHAFQIFRRKNPSEIINKNLELILKKTTPAFVEQIMELLFINREIANNIKDKIDLVINRMTEIGKISSSSLYCVSGDVIKKLRLYYGDDFIEKNLDKILGSIPSKNLVYEIGSLKGISEDIDLKVNNYIENHLEDFIYGMMDIYKIQGMSSIEKKKLIEMYRPTVLEIINELVPKKKIIEEGKEYEKNWWIDIEKIGSGAYSDVYRIGNRVLKIGSEKATYKIPNHTRILQPIVRIELLMEDDTTPFGCIEVSERVEKLSEEDYNEENFYKIYKELREYGIIWTDFKPENLGKLIEPNTQQHIVNGEILNIVPYAVGFKGELQGEERKPGDLVILDTDYIYNENDKGIKWQQSGYAAKFEKRWQQEQQKRIAAEEVPQIKGREEEKDRYENI